MAIQSTIVLEAYGEGCYHEKFTLPINRPNVSTWFDLQVERYFQYPLFTSW